MQNDDINQRSEELIESLGNFIGENEIEARRFLGDKEYEEVTALIRINNNLTIAQSAAQVEMFKASAFLRSSIAVVSFWSMLLATVWSFVFWFK
jgi:hypothetical protein